MIDQDDFLARAAVAESLRDVAYELGRGGRDPSSPTPADARGRCDCSGLTAWLHRLDRRQLVEALPGAKPDLWRDVDGDGDLDPVLERWLSTAGILEDALGMKGQPPARRWYEPIDRPEIGALVVFAAGPGRAFGHVGGIVGGLPAEWDPRSVALWRRLRVIHCHGPKGTRPAIEVTGAETWWRWWGAHRGTAFVRRVR